MTKIKLVCVAIAVCLSIGCACPCGKQSQNFKPALRHVVMFQFKAETTPAQVKEIENAFRALPSKIPGIAGFEWGTNVSPENLAQGFTHCFFLTFKSAADRDAYLPHPAHKAFGAMLKGHIEKVLVVDYWAKE
jgi:hypothetical protein